jgi:putative transcriptional regulator
MGDKRFFEGLIYIVDHNESGAMGLVINHQMQEMVFYDILKEMQLGEKEELILISEKILNQKVLRGGPVEKGRGFVLHSPDYSQKDNSFPINEEISMTATTDILKAIAFGPSPKNTLFALGYCGWSEGQLENEIKNNGWLISPYSKELIFEIPIDKKYNFALSQIGANRASLSPTSGNA